MFSYESYAELWNRCPPLCGSHDPVWLSLCSVVNAVTWTWNETPRSALFNATLKICILRIWSINSLFICFQMFILNVHLLTVIDVLNFNLLSKKISQMLLNTHSPLDLAAQNASILWLLLVFIWDADYLLRCIIALLNLLEDDSMLTAIRQK